jgi:hypothetical protein
MDTVLGGSLGKYLSNPYCDGFQYYLPPFFIRWNTRNNIHVKAEVILILKTPTAMFLSSSCLMPRAFR